MGRKKSKKNMYFHEGIQDAIIQYNQSEDSNFKSRIYGEVIHVAFDKLAENIINTFKFTYFDDVYVDVKQEVVSFLVINMHKYDHTKGSKAFSYFSVVAKNYLILHNNNNYKKYKSHTDLKALNKQTSQETTDESSVFINELVRYFESNINNMFKKKRDIDIAFSIIELLRRKDEIENFNKKSIYLLIREMTGVKTTQITKILNKMKKTYKTLHQTYYKNGTITSGSNSKFFI